MSKYDNAVRTLVGIVDRFQGASEAAQELGYDAASCMRREVEPCGWNSRLEVELGIINKVGHAIRGHGFTMLGSGYFSQVFEHPAYPDVVFKLSMRKDDAYNAYALHCRATPHKHAPRFYSIVRGAECTVYCLPKYLRLSQALPSWEHCEWYEHCSRRTSNSLYRASILRYREYLERFFKDVAVTDFNSDNLMYDPATRQVIFTDPVSFKHT